MYADDVKISISHNNDENVILLQNGLNEVIKWSKKWRIDINPEKTYVFI